MAIATAARKLAAGLTAGAWGGALVGLVEASLISLTSAPEELGLFPFAWLAYGGCGALLGLVVALLLVIVDRGGRRPIGPLAGALAMLPLGLAVARYHIILRIFHEDLPPLSSVGLAVHLGIVMAGIVSAALLYHLVKAVSLERHLLVSLSLFAAVAAATAGISRAAAARASTNAASILREADAESGANVVLIIADTLRADSAARRMADRPEGGLARLARDGARFTQAHAQSTWTRPSVATIVTSLYPSQHGAIQKMQPLSDDVTTVAEVFRDEGFWTAAFVSNINVAPIFNFQQGFGEYHYLAPSFYFGASDSATRLAIYKGLRVARERLFRDRIHFENYYQDAKVLTKTVSDWLDQAPPSPFFLLIHFMDPHDPYFEIPYNGHGVARVNDPNPAAARASELRALYEENTDYFDDELSLLLNDLDRRGLYSSSVVALVSDHGEEFQEHGGWWHGSTLYEEELRVPMLIKRANESERGAVLDRQARLLDIAPTLVASAGLGIPNEFEGRDLWSPADQGPLFAEEELEGNTLYAVRVGNWKLITANADNPRGLKAVELYDLERDPSESRNLAAAMPEKVEELATQLDQFLDRAGTLDGE